ncbi:MAG: VCBS repeat-containing protein, partial [Actinomycetota bacterium]
GNGKPDIAWHNAGTGRVMIWYLSGADGDTLTSSTTVTRANGIDWPATQWKPVGAGEFNRDGTPDLLWHNTSNGSLVVWTMSGGAGSNASDEVRVSASSFPPPTKVPIVWR